jgi:hypothetical protein
MSMVEAVWEAPAAPVMTGCSFPEGGEEFLRSWEHLSALYQRAYQAEYTSLDTSSLVLDF